MSSRLRWVSERHVLALVLMGFGGMLLLRLPDRFFAWFIDTVMQAQYSADPDASGMLWPIIGGVVFAAGVIVWNWRVRSRRPT